MTMRPLDRVDEARLRADITAVLGEARHGERVEVHCHVGSTAETTVGWGGPKERSTTAAVRQMVAVRSFSDSTVGFCYTTDLTRAGMVSALQTARRTRGPSVLGGFPTRGAVEDTGEWQDRSSGLPDLEEAFLETATESQHLILKRTVTLVAHAESTSSCSDPFHRSYVSGCTVVALRHGPRVDSRWGRALDLSTVSDLQTRTRDQGPTKNWSMRRRPVVFIGAAGAAVLDLVTRAITTTSGTVAAEVAAALPATFRLVDDARDPSGPAAAPFDGVGSPTRKTVLIQGGELLVPTTSWEGTATSASVAGLMRRPDLARPPIPLPANIHLEGGGLGDDLVSRIDRGFACTQIYSSTASFEPSDASFAVSVTGRLIRSGELGARVRGVIRGDVVSLLVNLAGASTRNEMLPLTWGVQSIDMLVDDGMELQGS